MTDFSDTKPMGLYEAAIGEKCQNYYVSKFEDFDEQGPGLHASWNWAAFFFTGYWALYRKMYVWFVAWLVALTFMGILSKIQSVEFARGLLLVNVILWLGFTAYANSLYHRKIRARIAAAQNQKLDASRVSKRLSAGAGVHMWVPIGLGGLTILGVVAAVALPAYQDYSKRQTVAARPVQAPAPQVDMSQFQPVPDAQSGAESPNSNSDKEVLKKQGIGGNQELTDVAAWGDMQMSARFFNALDLQKGQSFVLMWQRQIIHKLRLSPERALFLAYSIVVSQYDGKKTICRPDMSRNGGIEDLPGGEMKIYPECFARNQN